MNAARIHYRFDRRKTVWILSCGAATLFAAAVVAAAQRSGEADRGGATLYTPTRGEWLCILLNSRHALANSEQIPRELVVHYSYDRSKPNVIGVNVLLTDRVSDKEQVRRCTVRAEEHAIATAKIYGWQDWLKVEHRAKVYTDDSATGSLIH
jgi:hypothetical protein